ncbi:MAG: glycosyltransferase, partial [Methylococcus sp.]
MGSEHSVNDEALEIVDITIEDYNNADVTEVTEVDDEVQASSDIERQALAAKEEQNWLLAVELWSRLIHEDEPSLRWLLELAIAQRESGQLQESLATLQQAESLHGMDCWIADNRARAHLALGEHRQAVQHWREAVELTTNDADREGFELMLCGASESADDGLVAHDLEGGREMPASAGVVNLDNGVTVEFGVAGSRLWILATDPFEDHLLQLGADGQSFEAAIQWFARPDAFIYQTLQNINLLPNPGFQSPDGKSLEGWERESVESCAVDVDFSDHFRLQEGHTAYLYAPAGAPRPALHLQQPIPIIGDMGLSYRFSAFISIHRGSGALEATFLDVHGNYLTREFLELPQTDQHPGGGRLPDYQWIEWLIRPPRDAKAVHLRIALGEHNGQHPEDSFLFLTLPFFGIAAEQAQAWDPRCLTAGRLLHAIEDDRWNRFGVIDVPPDMKTIQVLGQTLEFGTVQRPSDLMNSRQALAGALQHSLGGPVWLACRWPIAGDLKVSHRNELTSARVGGLLSQQELFKTALHGQNLLPNSDFSEGLAHWQAIPDAGVDFAPNVKPAGGHAAYIFRKAGTETDVTRLYMESLTLPPGSHTFQLSGLFGYHRCLGHLGIEWLDGQGSSLGEILLQPRKVNARGGQRLSNYDVQEAQISVADRALSFRVFVEKSITSQGHKDSFLFFTRLLLAPLDGGRLKWRRSEPEAIERVIRFGKLASHFQRLEGPFHSMRVGQILFEEGAALDIDGPDLIEAHSGSGEQQERGVINGNFEAWGHGLTKISDHEEIPVADGWYVHNPGLARINVAATRIRTRDPWSGNPGEQVHALEIDYADAVDHVALMGALVTERLQPRKGAVLRLYLSTGDSGNYACLDSVDVLLGEDRVINLANRVQFGAAGRYFEFRLSVTDAEQLQSCGLPVHLRLNLGFSGHCRLADVSLTSVIDEKPRNDAHTTVPSLEDPNLESQYERIKLVENWGKSTRFECVSRYAPLSSEPRVEIIIPVYNALQETLDCLHSIRGNTTVPYALTVIDDASEPEVTQALRAYQQRNPGLTLLHNETNLGYTRTANLGFAHARAEWVVLLNSDTIVTPGWLEGLLECAESDPDIKFVGPLSNAATWQSVPAVFDVMGKFKVNCLPSGYTAADMARLVEAFSRRAYPRVKLLNGFCTLIHRQTVMELGLLDEMAFPQGYGEENDLCLRAAEAGYQLAIADHVYVYHAKSASFGPVRRNTLSKAGSDALRRKHPAVDLARVQADIAESPSLIQLRQDLRT